MATVTVHIRLVSGESLTIDVPKVNPAPPATLHRDDYYGLSYYFVVPGSKSPFLKRATDAARAAEEAHIAAFGERNTSVFMRVMRQEAGNPPPTQTETSDDQVHISCIKGCLELQLGYPARFMELFRYADADALRDDDIVSRGDVLCLRVVPSRTYDRYVELEGEDDAYLLEQSRSHRYEAVLAILLRGNISTYAREKVLDEIWGHYQHWRKTEREVAIRDKISNFLREAERAERADEE